VSNENSSGEDGKSAEKSVSAADSTDRESSDEVPKYEGQWAALSDEEFLESDGDSDGSSDLDADESAEK
jgi:hypothetical protein